MIGRTISGRYVVQAIIGMGGMAVVYRAYDQKARRVVAMKVLRPEFESDEEFVRRFSREAEAASKVSHENIVNMLDVGTDGDLRYIVMEYVDGTTLKELIRQQGPIPQDQAIRMTIRILAAVDHAHRNGIVHRDIKPQNILVDSDGTVKVADFGIARLKAEQTTVMSDTEGGTTALGSVHYFSPEQARGEVADEKSDLYSVGVVMYEMLTGSVPFDGETSVSVALKHLNEQPKPMRQRRGSISRALDEVVMRALSKDATRRYQTAAEFAADLRKAVARPQGGFVKYPKTPEELEQEKEARRRRRERDARRLRVATIALSIGVMLAAMGAGLWYYSHMRSTYVMPNLVGQEQMLAQDAMEHLNAPVEIAYSYSEDYEEGIVMRQSVETGSRARYADAVVLTVSRGTPWYYLQNYTGQQAEAAAAALRAEGVESVEVDYVQSDAAPGTVISMNLKEGMRAKNEAVVLTASGQSVLMPLLTGQTAESAAAILSAEGLLLGAVTDGYASDAKADTVIGQSVSANSQVLAGTAVDITVNRAGNPAHYPASKLSVVVPLNGSEVVLSVTTPSGSNQEISLGALNAGTYRVALSSPEEGEHRVSVIIDGVVIERQMVDFE